MQTWVVFQDELSPEYLKKRHIIREKSCAPILSAVVDTSSKAEAEYRTVIAMSLRTTKKEENIYFYNIYWPVKFEAVFLYVKFARQASENKKSRIQFYNDLSITT